MSASFNEPSGIAIDGSGNLFVADHGSHLIRKIDPSGKVTTIAGSGSRGSTDGKGAAASFNGPRGIAVDVSGNLFVVDQSNHLVRKVDASGNVTTIAGSGIAGSNNGQGTAASFFFPFGITVDTSGNVYVADQSNNLIRKVDSNGNVTTLAGSGVTRSADGQGATASFNSPTGITIDSRGNLFVNDYSGNLVRKIDKTGNVTTVAGSGAPGSSDGQPAIASFKGPIGIAIDTGGNLFVGDALNNLIRKVTAVSYN